jgi:hypothetical protein
MYVSRMVKGRSRARPRPLSPRQNSVVRAVRGPKTTKCLYTTGIRCSVRCNAKSLLLLVPAICSNLYVSCVATVRRRLLPGGSKLTVDLVHLTNLPFTKGTTSLIEKSSQQSKQATAWCYSIRVLREPCWWRSNLYSLHD